MSQSVEARLRGLKSLPELELPAGLEAKTLAAMAAAGEERNRFPLSRAAAWLAVAVTGLLVAAVAFNTADYGEERSANIVDSAGSGEPAMTMAPAAVLDDSAFLALLEEIDYLEQVLAVLPQREVMRVGTAGTIVGLEQQIAQIDEALWITNDQPVSPQYRYTLLRDRVETMNALVNVRYSQSRAFSY